MLPLCTIIIESHFGIRDELDALVDWGKQIHQGLGVGPRRKIGDTWASLEKP